MKKYSIIFKALLVLSGFLGIVIHALTSKNIIQTFSYYTMHSNILITVIFIAILIYELKNKSWRKPHYILLKGMFTIGILVTFIIYHFFLRPYITAEVIEYNPGSFKDILVHYITPILVILDWAIFDSKGAFKWYYPLIWLIQPVLYLLYTFFYRILGGEFRLGEGVSRFPYFFLDYDKFGITHVIFYMIFIVMMYVLLGYILYIIDWLLGSRCSIKK